MKHSRLDAWQEMRHPKVVGRLVDSAQITRIAWLEDTEVDEREETQESVGVELGTREASRIVLRACNENFPIQKKDRWF